MAIVNDIARKAPLAPEGFSLRRLTGQAMGLALLVAAILLALALATHDRADPSWNHAADRDVANALGLGGARVSDALLQGLGLGSWLLPLILLDWAVRLLLGRGLARLWLKLVLLAPMLAAAALALSIFPAPARWPLAIGLGGALGGLGARTLDAANLAPPLAAMAAAALVGLLLLYVMGFSPSAWARALAARKVSERPARPGIDRAHPRPPVRLAQRRRRDRPQRRLAPRAAARPRAARRGRRRRDGGARAAPRRHRRSAAARAPQGRARAPGVARPARSRRASAAAARSPARGAARQGRGDQRGVAAAERAAPRIRARGLRRARARS